MRLMMQRPSHPALHVRDDRDTPLFVEAGRDKGSHGLDGMQSGLFFAPGLDDPNQLEIAREISILAQVIFRLGKPVGEAPSRQNVRDLPVGRER
jgi:hypothetical protein